MAFSPRPRRPASLERDTTAPAGKRARATFGAGSYIGCSACGRLLKIEWAVRSLVCSCGARVNVAALSGK